MLPITVTKENYKQWLKLGVRFVLSNVKTLLFFGKTWDERLIPYVLENSLKSDPDSVLRAIDKFAANEQFMMNVGEEKGGLLDQTIVDTKATNILELGTYCGYSAIRIARLIQENNGHLFTIEKNPKYAAIAKALVEHAGLTERVDVITGEAATITAKFDSPFDVVFLDHWKNLYLSDLLLLEKHNLLREGTVVVADNVGIFQRDLIDYLDHVRNSGKYDSKFYETSMEYNPGIKDGVEISVCLT